jgi:cobalt-zinc-cadmium efflux system membrane fusion protein
MTVRIALARRRRAARAAGTTAAAGALLLALLAACGGPPAAPEEAAAATPHAPDRVRIAPAALAELGIRTAPAERRALGAELQVNAVIRANENRLAHVSPRIPGKAIEVKAVLGDRVAAGEALALLDSLVLGEKKSAFLQARANLEVARRNSQREERLFRDRIASERDYLEAKGELERRDAAYRAAREALRLLGLADAAIDTVSWGDGDHPLSHFPIQAPFAGTVIEQHITLGELIEPGATAYTIADLSTLWIVLDVYEKDLGTVAVGTAAEVRVDAYPDRRFTGHITYVSDVVDERTRTARARVEVDNAAGGLRPGMFATATVALADRAAPVVTIPLTAVQRIDERPVAFVAEAPGSYAVRQLTLGQQSGDVVEVRDGIAAGEPVVTAGSFTLKSVALEDQLAGED